MGNGLVRQRSINEEMREAYLDYAMSVIVSRALPDARDGLKPVHRRILYAMHNMGSLPDSPYRKSARIVGEVLGKFHPHGDLAVYEAMVRMAQDFSMRYELIDGQGNFGSIDGDAAAAMRYTEARISHLGSRLLDDIEKNTVDFTPNFDGSLIEPLVLPASVPNLLVNGSSGIAVGMSTSVPPHNLGEVCSALTYMLDNWEQLDDVTVTDLMRFIQGPDFPTGGIVYTRYNGDTEDQLVTAYATGRGKVIVRAKVHLEALDRGRTRIIVSEIPFQTNKNSLIERIAELAQTGKVEGLSDLRDESDRQGLRIVIEVSRAADPAEVLADLFKYTPLQSTFSIIMLALVDGEPRMVTLKQALRIYIEHRLEVIRRRSEFDLEKAESRAHILEGLLIALKDIEAVIQTIRRSRTSETARANLMKNFHLTEAQAQAILDMRLRRLAQLEQKSLKDEYDQIVRLIQDLRALLASAVLMRLEVRRELTQLAEAYHDRRRTTVTYSAPTDVTAGDLLVPEEATAIILTRKGKLSRTYPNELPVITVQDEDAPRFIHQGTSADILYLFTVDGYAATIPVSQIPPAVSPFDGAHFSTLGALKEGNIVALLSVPMTLPEGYIFFTSAQGEVKRMRLDDLPGVRADTFRVFDVEAGDSLLRADIVFDNEHVILVTRFGQAIHFHVGDVRPTGLSAGGMRGIKLRDAEDQVVGAGVATPESHIVVITPDVRGKRSDSSEYPIQGRAGGGVRTLRAGKGQDLLIASAAVCRAQTSLIFHTRSGHIFTLGLDDIPKKQRDYRADFFLNLALNERLETLAPIEPPIRYRTATQVELPIEITEENGDGDAPENGDPFDLAENGDSEVDAVYSEQPFEE